MADRYAEDVDYEDSPLAPPAGDGPDDDELDEDLAQDWRFLAQAGKSAKTLPKRGEKEYEPDGTAVAAQSLQDSREAMFAALGHARTHSAKAHVAGVWLAAERRCRVLVARGPHFKSVGRADRGGVLYLLPEEVLYLVERGSMLCYYEPADGCGQIADEDGLVPMSLQACYAACLPACGGNERYFVYAHLKRLGFLVQRAPTFDPAGRTAIDAAAPPRLDVRVAAAARAWAAAVAACARRQLVVPPAFGPLVAAGAVWRSYDQVYARLRLVPCHSHAAESPAAADVDPDPVYRVAYNVWKPRPAFKKSAPGEPDFRVVALNASRHRLPTLAQLRTLFAGLAKDAGFDRAAPHMRLRDGYKNVLIALFDNGIVSFNRLADVSFGDAPLGASAVRNAHKGGRRRR
ncbi:tRNA-splicing endonuclease subunit sen54 N-term-domain-containing protein [Dipodascopsis tothii]|uniref:tRNA-splicing endonuclease subunit sen54 N-term-domain-containing protein n=1 Tax=Dipodascopsis tothii TaxID=44089 RepID=UPI0034D00ED6